VLHLQLLLFLLMSLLLLVPLSLLVPLLLLLLSWQCLRQEQVTVTRHSRLLNM